MGVLLQWRFSWDVDSVGSVTECGKPILGGDIQVSLNSKRWGFLPLSSVVS